MQQLLCSASATSQVTKEKPRFACKRPPKDVRDKIEQILLKSSTDIRILSRFFWHFPNTQIYSKQQRISRKHWLRYWQKRSSARSEKENIQKVCLAGGCCSNSLLTSGSASCWNGTSYKFMRDSKFLRMTEAYHSAKHGSFSCVFTVQLKSKNHVFSNSRTN